MSIIDEINDLDWTNLGGWQTKFKIIAAVFIVIAILGLGYYLFINDQRIALDKLQKEEVNLKSSYAAKYKKAAQLDDYKNQLEEMEIILQSMLRQLPSKNEMSDLIVDVSQSALGTGIANELFEPGAENLKDFYAEKPISLKMKGNYHDFGAFVSGVASLPRVVILTMHDISLKPTGDSLLGGQLILEGTAKTYRYLDDEEVASISAKAGGKK
jgi:type IV pilus assembly protein PilO